MSSARFAAEAVLKAAQAAKQEAMQASGTDAVALRMDLDRLIKLATAAKTVGDDRIVVLSTEDLVLLYQQIMTK